MNNNQAIDLSGIIGSDLIFYNTIIEKYYQKVSMYNTHTSVTCDISFKEIEVKNSNNCEVHLINKCHSNKSTNLNIFLEVLVENSYLLEPDIKKKLEISLGVDLSSKEPQLNKGFMKKCNAFASVNNSIKVGKLNIDNCNSLIPLKFIFYNTGDASVNCGINELLNSLGKNSEESKEDNYVFLLNKVLGLLFSDLIYLIIFFFIMIMIFLFLFIYFKRPNNIIYSFNHVI